ncbi:Bardet-Biedl syndrome 7 protein [Hondaea fermentalgiana]|uniref:Bardet-Biedl syndrome 7 protein n=1 Tax=Hondaea fermentalgiana TaxID=2315210 RepID=A0A2R5G027_9STRA|nr:Bardet-Biedl syndrome 7 protein [Hondaea fermentalgiana]|eukprot:GBG23875.1 Bardet-Biedl syndrome 7 protein [Hondaea fermentalgiana]
MELSRSDLATVGPVSGVDTLKVLPFGSKSRRQKVVVGDNAGFVTCLQSKRGETTAVYKTRVADGGNAIAALALAPKGDTVFAAEGRNVHGLNRKGKVAQRFETKLSEAMQCLVAGDDDTFWASGDHTYTAFQRERELDYMSFGDAVTSLAVAAPNNNGEHTALVGGQGHQIRAVRRGNIGATLATTGAPTSLEELHARDGSDNLFVYGTSTGSLGLLQADNKAQNPELRRIWESQGDGGINCIATHDLSKDDVPDIIVGRDDGRLQVYRLQEEGSGLMSSNSESKHARSAPGLASLQFERFVDESVRSVQAGVVSTPGFDEVVLCTYSGNIISFSSEALDAAEVGDKQGRTKADIDVEGRTAQLRSDLKAVQKQIDATRAKLLKVSGKNDLRTEQRGGINFEQLQVSQRFDLLPRKGYHVLALQMAVPMSLVVLHSDLPIRLLDAEEATASDAGRGAQSMVITKTESAQGLHAVFRPQEPCKRVEIRIGTLEGQHGQLRVTVVAATSPPLGRQLTVDVKPLSLHQRCDVIANVDRVPLSNVSFSGSFSLHQAHDWIQSCLPDVPATVPSLSETSDAATMSSSRSDSNCSNSSQNNNNNNNNSEEKESSPDGGSASDRGMPQDEPPTASLYYRSTLVDSVLIVRYRSGLVKIESDSVSAIAIAREVITAEANRRKANVAMRFNIRPDTVPYFLQHRLDAKLVQFSALASRDLLVDALREICSDADGSANGAFLAPEHRSLLAAPGASDAAQLTQAKLTLQALHGVVSDLYVDVQKFAGRDVRSPHVHAALSRILENYSLQDLRDFFAGGAA